MGLRTWPDGATPTPPVENAVRAHPLPSPPLLVISDRSQVVRPLVEIAEAVFRAGGRWFSLREKDLPADERRALLRALVSLGGRFGATVAVHDDIDSAIAAGAAGVHLPGGGEPAAARRRLASALIGVSAHSPQEAAAQLAAGADYATLSPVFLTSSKPGYGPAVGLDALAEAARLAGGPVVALGGIGDSSIGACLAAGARGIAVMGEIMRAADPEAATRRLLAAMQPNRAPPN
jgi:thiamine-phosphate pyrophosphorylase